VLLRSVPLGFAEPEPATNKASVFLPSFRRRPESSISDSGFRRNDGIMLLVSTTKILRGKLPKLKEMVKLVLNKLSEGILKEIMEQKKSRDTKIMYRGIWF
jgi:hypothetical protein